MRVFIVTIVTILIFMLIGCSGDGEQANEPSHMGTSENNHASHSNMQMDTAEPSEESIYNVSSMWKNRHGEELQLNKLRGKVQVWQWFIRIVSMLAPVF